MSNFWGEGEGHSCQKRCPTERSRGGGKAFGYLWMRVWSALIKANTRQSMWVDEVGPIQDVCASRTCSAEEFRFELMAYS